MHCGSLDSALGNVARGKRLPWALLALFCVGYGTFSSAGYAGFTASVFYAYLSVGTDALMLMRAIFLAGTGVACLLVRALEFKGVVLLRPLVALACYGAILLCYILQALLSSSIEAVYILSVFMGTVAAIPLLFWFDVLVVIFRSYGRGHCLFSLVACMLVARLLVVPEGILAAHGFAIWAALVMCLGASAGALLLFYRIGSLSEGAVVLDGTTSHEPYRVTLYTATTVASFGITWGLTIGCTLILAGMGAAWLTQMASGLLVYIPLLVVLLRRAKGEGVRFGALIRVALVVAGLAFGVAPLLMEAPDGVLSVLSQATGGLLGMVMMLISVEISYERGLSTTNVMPVNYIIFVVCSCVTMLLPGVLEGAVGNGAAWSWVAAIAVAAVVMVIPVLPASSSTAATFALKTLPENEGYEARVMRTRENMAARFGLSARENEVLDLLLKGMTRNEIAADLGLSSWTVKEYIAGVYNKVGVHSAKELMVLVAAGE